jgi:hypothetical protein
MPKYLFEATYRRGAKGVVGEGDPPGEQQSKAITGIGGRLEEFYLRSATSTRTSSPTFRTTCPRPP